MFKKGFSLIEMAIVIIIIGILIGALVGGRNLLRSATINAVVSDLKSYEVAYNKFRDIYNARPGDMPDALDVFGDVDGNGNGNGNAIIGAFIIDDFSEYFLVWKHLELAGLIEGSYSGSNGDYYNYVPAVDSPEGPLPLSGYHIQTTGGFSEGGGTADYQYCGNNGIVFFKGQGGASIGTYMDSGQILPPADMYIIDKKMDDGMPFTGVIAGSVSKNIAMTNASPSACIRNGNYNMLTKYNACYLTYFVEKERVLYTSSCDPA